MTQIPINKYQVMPDLSIDDYAELKADIASRGVQVAVEYDEDGNILDGHHRILACTELGITDWPKVVRVGMSEEQKREHARKLNMARRHLTREQRQELIRQQLIDTPEKSDRQIAHVFGVSPTTVGTARKGMEDSGELSKLDSSIGADGKERPRQVDRKPMLSGLGKPITIFEPTKEKIEQAKELLETAVPELINAIATGKVPLMQGVAVAAAAEQHEQKEAVNRLESGQAEYLMDGLNQQRMEACLKQTPEQRKEMEQRIRENDKKIDREFALSAMIHKMIDAVLQLRVEDIDEAVQYFVDHDKDLAGIDYTVKELGECIGRLQLIKIAFSRTKHLKVVK